MAKNYYETLGIEREASEKEVRAAYRRLARKHHPDVNSGDKGAEAKFKEINEAYQVLSNAESRKKYDRFGDNWRHADEARTGAGRGESSYTWFNRARTRRPTSAASAGFGGLGDVFGDLFSGQRAHSPEEMFARRQFDAPATITLEEAYAGTKRTVQSPPDPITGAAGKRLEVSIPAGVESGSRVHVSANGGPSAGQGVDLNLSVTVSPHSTFTREGDNLRLTADVPLVDAVLGGEIEAPVITGKSVVLKIPPETQNGRVFRLRGKGMPKRRGGGYGDQLVTVRVVLPTGLTDEERALFERLRESERARA